MKSPAGWFGWAFRIVGVLGVTIALATAGLVVYFALAVYPKERAEQAATSRRTAAFAQLQGSARRLAVYDAFVEQIDRNYYDQAFSGISWTAVKREERLRAADAVDDAALYTSVFFQIGQQFPASHVVPIPPWAGATRVSRDLSTSARPAPPTASPRGSASLSDVNRGFQIAKLRRGARMCFVVGEVWHGSRAESAGVTPGWIIGRAEDSMHGESGHFSGTFLRIDSNRMHDADSTCTALAVPQINIEYDYLVGDSALPVVARRLASGVTYIRFDRFEDSVLRTVAAALMNADGRGVIMDLRFNSGGKVMPLLDILLPAGTAVFNVRNARGRHEISSHATAFHYTGPVAVLTGPASMSAAELAAAVLQAAHRAIIVGRVTNGSVLGAEYFPLPDGGQVEVPVEDVELLDGTRLEGHGAVPDVEIIPTLEQVRSGSDRALHVAELSLTKTGS